MSGKELELSYAHATPATELQADLRRGHRQRHVVFRSGGEPLHPSGGALAALALLPCMRRGWDCRLRAELDRDLASGLERMQEVWRVWHPRWRRVAFHGEAVSPADGPRGSRVGLFFSGGVDSFYSLYSHLDEVTDLIFVVGFDIAVDNPELREQAAAMVRQVGAQLGKNVIEIETNLRQFLDRHVSWYWGHGPGLACVGHLLSGGFRRIYLASNQSVTNHTPVGSHPDLDPCWSSRSLEFIYDASKATRFEKLRRLVSENTVKDHLRVCWRNPGNVYNCGKCEKCLRTMVALEALGVLVDVRTFPGEVDCRAVGRMLIDHGVVRSMHEENLRALQQSGRNPELAAALERVLRSPQRTRRYARGLWLKIYNLWLWSVRR